MKPATADPHYKIHCIRIIPLWGDPVYITDHPRDLVIGANTYKTASGYEFTGMASEGNMSPGVVDLSGIADIAGIGYDQIVSGVFDNARVYVFATTWRSPVVDEEPMGMAFMGKITLKDQRYTAELMMMVDALNQSVGKSYLASCPKKFGGQEFAGCKVALGPLTVTGTVTSVIDNATFRDGARTEPYDYFAEGTIVFTSGANAGLKPQEVKVYHLEDAGIYGYIQVHEAFHYPVVVGDTYTMIPGCRKRMEDCRDKWNNIINFGGFSFIPTSSQYLDRGLN
ncbi:MAG: DUF2163 domain-containing protein [Methylobacter sp.]